MHIFELLGTIIFLVFYSSYFIKMILQRRQGIKTDSLGRGAKPRRTRNIEILLKTFTYSMALIQVISIAAKDYLPLLIHSSIIRYVGAAIGFVGIFIFITAMVTMQNNWRAGVDPLAKTTLITHGIYSFSRNPAFMGFDLFYLGFTLLFFNIIQLIFLLCCIVILHFQILEEEKFLITNFRADYTNYKQTTARYFIFF